MKTTISKQTYQEIYNRLNAVLPVDGDCGELCGALCCTYSDDSDDDVGIYLLPGEDQLFSKDEPWLTWSTEIAEECDFPDSWEGEVYFVGCKNPPNCDRAKRPLQCKFFPVSAHITEDNELVLIRHIEELPYSCPLQESDTKLNEDFLRVCYDAWIMLMEDPLIYDLVYYDSSYRDSSLVDIVYPIFLPPISQR